jgi:dTDP-4-dehydrorhamnose reductase
LKILILGGDGMLGHQLVESLSPSFDIAATYRLDSHQYAEISDYQPPKCFYEVNAQEFGSVDAAIREANPDAIVNSIGIVKQRADAKNAIASIEVNALFPHKVSSLASTLGARFINISTDCVFSGRKGMYREDDVPDAEDLYGRSKLLGEVATENALTLRTSIIGLELSRKESLIEWFLRQRGSIKGYRGAIYSGFVTLEVARVIADILANYTQAKGLYHVSSDPIDKFTLLSMLRDRLNLGLDIEPDDEFVSDKSLNSERFKNEFHYTPPSWTEMIDELANQIEERYR